MNLDKLLEYQAEDHNLRKIEEEIKLSEEYKKYAQANRFMGGAQEKLDLLDRRANELKALLEEVNRRDEEITSEIAEYNGLEDMIKEGGDASYYEKTAQNRAFKADGRNQGCGGGIQKVPRADDRHAETAQGI